MIDSFQKWGFVFWLTCRIPNLCIHLIGKFECGEHQADLSYVVCCAVSQRCPGKRMLFFFFFLSFKLFHFIQKNTPAVQHIHTASFQQGPTTRFEPLWLPNSGACSVRARSPNSLLYSLILLLFLQPAFSVTYMPAASVFKNLNYIFCKILVTNKLWEFRQHLECIICL